MDIASVVFLPGVSGLTLRTSDGNAVTVRSVDGGTGRAPRHAGRADPASHHAGDDGRLPRSASNTLKPKQKKVSMAGHRKHGLIALHGLRAFADVRNSVFGHDASGIPTSSPSTAISINPKPN